MEKPLSIKREEFLAALVQVINDCGLPPCVCSEVIRGVAADVETVARRQLENDRKAWEAAQKEEGHD